MKYFIRNMVCNRCIMMVQQVFESLDSPAVHIVLGEVETLNPLGNEKLNILQKKLTDLGFELIDDTKSQMIEKIKTLIIEMVHYGKGND